MSVHRQCCCYRHIPHLADILPEHAALVEIVRLATIETEKRPMPPVERDANGG